MLSYHYKGEDGHCNETWEQWDEFCYTYWYDECDDVEEAMWREDDGEGEGLQAAILRKKTKSAKKKLLKSKVLAAKQRPQTALLDKTVATQEQPE